MLRAGLALLVIGLIACRSAREPKGSVPTAKVAETSSAPDESDHKPAPFCPDALASARRGGATPNKYVTPTDEQRERLRQIVELLLQADAKEHQRAAESAAAIAFEIVPAPEIPGTLVLRERANHGGGAYLVRVASTSRLLVEAPHTFYDTGTLPLACELFQRTRARALFIDTVHRYTGAPADAKGEHPADVAHAERSMFHTATVALLRAVPNATVVQLHGFSAGEGRGSVVVSSGEGRPADPLVAKVHASFQHILGNGVLRFPEDTSELGATTNVQGVAAREARGRFLHLEMAEPVRRMLLKDASLRTEVLGALGDALAKD